MSHATRTFGFERWLARHLFESRSSPDLALALWDGTTFAGTPAARGRVDIRDRPTFYELLMHPELVFGDSFAAGRIEVEGDLVSVLEALFRAPAKGSLVERIALAWRRRRGESNTLQSARGNIHRHYDLGNDFYALWLDREMVYTCAYFPNPAASLEDAQRAKFEHVARKLWLAPGQRVLELGCGWGSLAIHLARHYGVDVTAFNISAEQIEFARERTSRLGLTARVHFVEDDYRNARGSYDAVVSVGMLEHVGSPHFRALGRTIDRCLRSDGRGLLHSIGRVRPLPMNAWIERRIFPGSYAPTLSEMVELLAPFELAVLDVENLRLHYALTLEHWLERYEKHIDEVKARTSESFARAWRLYLAGSIAAFRTSSLQLWQLVFARQQCTSPWTRAHIYTS